MIAYIKYLFINLPVEYGGKNNTMAKQCAVTGKSSQAAGRYTNRTRATEFVSSGKRRQYANLQKKTIHIPELGKKVRLTLSTKAIKTINKKGAFTTLKKAGLIR